MQLVRSLLADHQQKAFANGATLKQVDEERRSGIYSSSDAVDVSDNRVGLNAEVQKRCCSPDLKEYYVGMSDTNGTNTLITIVIDTKKVTS